MAVGWHAHAETHAGPAQARSAQLRQDRADHLYRMARKTRNMHRVEPASTGPVVGGGLHLRAHLVRDGDAIA